jgi:hypothetical protein
MKVIIKIKTCKKTFIHKHIRTVLHIFIVIEYY